MPLEWPRISVLVTSYRRPALVARTLERLRSTCDYPNLEFVLSDDGSPEDDYREMLSCEFDRVVRSDRNRGLGANMNQGIRACTGSYILNLQDDWDFLGPRDLMRQAVEVLEAAPELHLVRFTTSGGSFAGAERRRVLDQEVLVATSRTTESLYLYSDNPHLKRATFHQTFGFFDEVAGGRSERLFCERFRERRDASVVWLAAAPEAFRHTGEISFRPERRLDRVRSAVAASTLGSLALRAYGIAPERVRGRIRRLSHRLLRTGALERRSRL